MQSRILGTLGTICLSATLLAQAPTYTISTVAGSQPSGLGDGGDARSALILSADGVAVDSSGNIYIADSVTNRVRKVAAGTNIITDFAGTGISGSGGDGSAAVKAGLSGPFGVAVDAAGNVYIADTGNSKIRKVDTSGNITTFAGTGNGRFGGDGKKATLAVINSPHGVAFDKNGVLYIADTSNNRIRSVTTDGIMHTVAGGGVVLGDGGLATQAQLNAPWGVWVDSNLNVIIADTNNNRVRFVSNSTGNISTIAGNGVATGSTVTTTSNPGSTQGSGTPVGSSYNAVASSSLGDGQVGTSATLNAPQNVTLDSAGNLYIADTKNSRVRKLAPVSGGFGGASIFTFAGCGNGCTASLGTANNTTLGSPKAIAFDASGNLLIADNNQIKRVDSIGSLTTIIGINAFSGDFGPATSAILSNPRGVAVGADGSVYVADSGNNRIRQILPGGTITTVAGGTTSGFAGDGNPAAFGRINITVSSTSPTTNGIAVAPNGDVYFADTSNGRIRKISGGIISTVASGLNTPSSLALDSNFNIYVAEPGSSTIRLVDPSSNVSILAGQLNTKGSGGDGGKATQALLNAPQGVAVDAQGNVYIADTGNDVVREVLTTGTSAGTILFLAGAYGSTAGDGDGNEATQRFSSSLTGIAVDAAGNVFLADQGNNRIRRLDVTTLNDNTVAGGNPSAAAGDGPALSANVLSPAAVAVDGSGNVLLTDRSGLIRKLTPGK